MATLTFKQFQIFDYLLLFKVEVGVMPTRSEIGKKFGIAKSTVQEHLRQLEKKKWIKINPLEQRGIEIIHRKVEHD